MRVDWFSPFPPAKSGIADFSALAVEFLRERCDLALWAEEMSDGNGAFRGAKPISRFDHRQACEERSIPVYNMGNDYSFHARIFELSQRVPGIVLVHDAGLIDFFHCHYAATSGEAFHDLDRVYDHATLELLTARRRSGAKVHDLRLQTPFLKTALRNALCAVAFSDEAMACIQAAATCPAYRMHLPYRRSILPGTPRIPGRLVVFGHLGDNRRIPELLAALCAYPRRSELRLDIFGRYHDASGLLARIAESGLGEIVTYHGFVSDAVLDDAIGSATLVVNLRYPSMGEASGSQLRAWSLATPTIVTPIGWYAKLPAGTVLFAPIEREQQSLFEAFRLATDEPERLVAMGEAGREFFLRNHTPEQFADDLLRVADDWPTLSARWTVEHWVRRSVDATSRWNFILSKPHWQGVATAAARLAPPAFVNDAGRSTAVAQKDYAVAAGSCESLPRGIGTPTPAARTARRFLTGRLGVYSDYLTAAASYFSKLPAEEVAWNRRKPFDPDPGNPRYFEVQYLIMNLLRELQIPAGGRVLEVGSGSGWITELLLLLSYGVDAVEPSSDLTRLAKDRCAAIENRYQVPVAGQVAFHETSFEDYAAPEAVFDAVIFFDALHHLYDEETAFKKAFDALRPGGAIGIVEGSWNPVNADLAAELEEEMRRYGTLENPFSQEYLDDLARRAGFVEITRYVAVNGFYPVAAKRQSLCEAASLNDADTNYVIARKPYGAATTADAEAATSGLIEVLSGGLHAETRAAKITVRITNTGESVWLSGRTAVGGVTLALRKGNVEASGFEEAAQRHPLPRLMPGSEIVLNVQFTVPPQASLDGWCLDLISEERFWFSWRGMKGPELPVLFRST